MESYDIHPVSAEAGPCVKCGAQGQVLMRDGWYCYGCALGLK